MQLLAREMLPSRPSTACSLPGVPARRYRSGVTAGHPLARGSKPRPAASAVRVAAAEEEEEEEEELQEAAFFERDASQVLPEARTDSPARLVRLRPSPAGPK
eukprot:CAMPEP_0202077406 /NCGR_PEP_ID=MMETSP0964-20121228/5367_1 /ASSEMBLY_ACC=CAM_ASM_000500 /TAXON_ID=4773 /ORGANISM="Schizochytrium aggregatum, Strain ATCC28209" /LENGTH=101 /DNA_ID=CAMNT_0048644683 /DNA_START=427 /DNA_END=730 /DNA_ORIENTATION=+